MMSSVLKDVVNDGGPVGNRRKGGDLHGGGEAGKGGNERSFEVDARVSQPEEPLDGGL